MEEAYNICIVSQETPKPRLPYSSKAKSLEAVNSPEVQNGNNARKKARSIVSRGELIDKLLYSFNYSNVRIRPQNGET